MMYSEIGLFIDGSWRINGSGGQAGEVINPATGKPFARLPHAGKADLDEALAAALKGFAVWRAMSAFDRCKIMHKTADLLRERCDVVARVLVQEQGKALAEARAELLTSVDILDWYAEEGRRSY